MYFDTFEVIEYIKMRLQDENANESLISQLIELVHDRLLLRLQEESLPSCFLSILKDAVIKLYRKTYFEGITSESSDGLTTTFVEDILSEYSIEISEYRRNKKGTVQFL